MNLTYPTKHLSHIPQYIIQNRNVHISVLNGALWYMFHCAICEAGLLLQIDCKNILCFCHKSCYYCTTVQQWVVIKFVYIYSALENTQPLQFPIPGATTSVCQSEVPLQQICPFALKVKGCQNHSGQQQSLKSKSCHDANFVINGDIEIVVVTSSRAVRDEKVGIMTTHVSVIPYNTTNIKYIFFCRFFLVFIFQFLLFFLFEYVQNIIYSYIIESIMLILLRLSTKSISIPRQLFIKLISSTQ